MTLVVNFKSQWIFISFDSDTKERVVKRSQDRNFAKLQFQKMAISQNRYFTSSIYNSDWIMTHQR